MLAPAPDLSMQGATQSYLLGQQLRSIYISTTRFLPTTFDPSLMYGDAHT